VALSPRYGEQPNLFAGSIDPRNFIIRAEDFGLPQARHRVIVVGERLTVYGCSAPATKRNTSGRRSNKGKRAGARALLTDAQRKRFDLEYPKRQVFSKTDLAKFLLPWEGAPDSVSKGSQKNFGEFAKMIGPQWEKSSDSFSETYYRRAIAKAVVFQTTDDLVTKQTWYKGGGIKSRVVPYAIAKLAHGAQLRGLYVDFEQIWRTQAVPEILRTALTISAERVHSVIMGDQSQIPNPLEWAKQQACWNAVKRMEVPWPDGWFETLRTEDEQKNDQRTGVKEQRLLNGIEAQMAVVRAGAEFWRSTRNWAVEKELLSLKEAGILEAAASMGLPPSEKQCMATMGILKRLHSEGYQHGLDMFA